MKKHAVGASVLVLMILFFSSQLGAQPVITSFIPAAGFVGTSVTISGSGFSNVPSDNIVYFGAVRANVSAASTVALSVNVPVGTTYEPISSTTNNLTGYSRSPFKITLSQPGIFTPASLNPRVDFAAGSPQHQIKACDFDNDGKIDVVSYYDLGVNGFYVSRNLSIANNISFSTPVAYNSFSSISDMTIADIDGDGKKDIVACYKGTSIISIFKNTSTVNNLNFSTPINFDPASSFSGSSPRVITTGDLDGDGKPEIIFSIKNANKVCILKNTTSLGIISYNPASEFATEFSPSKLICSDINNDGKQDLVVSIPPDGTVSIYQNITTTSISLAPRVNFDVGGFISDLAAGDLDDDGKIDLVISTSNNYRIIILRNSYSGSIISFAPKVELIAGSSPFSVCINDLTGDNKPDIAVSNSGDNSISLFGNVSTSGHIAFAKNQEYPGGQGVRSILAVDINNDNKTDIISSNYGAASFSTYLSRVNEPYILSFEPTTAPTDSIVTINGYNFQGTTSVLFGGVHASSFITDSGSTIYAKVGSGNSGDVVVSTVNSNSSLSGFTLGSIIPRPLIINFLPDTGIIGSLVTINGMNFDTSITGNLVRFGIVNAVITSASHNRITVTVPFGSTYDLISVSTNNKTNYSSKPFFVTFPGALPTFPTHVFRDSVNYSGNFTSHKFVLDDIDGDGKPDYAASVQGQNVMVRRNITSISTPSITFSAAQQLNTQSNTGDLVSGDLNGDGKPELIVANINQSSLSVIKNNSTIGIISFNPNINYLVGPNPGGQSVGDLDNDGKPDIVLVNRMESTNPAVIKVLRNTSTQTNLSFAAPASFHIGSNFNGSSQYTAVADLNGDGKPEIIVSHANLPFAVSILKNKCTPGVLLFDTAITFTSGGYPRDVSIGDIDGDGKPDIVVINSFNNYSISVFRNTSNIITGVISFAPKVDYTIGWQGNGITIGDLDGDGKPDITVSQSFNPSTIAIFKNVSFSGVISLQAKLDLPIRGSHIKLADLDGDGKLDIATSSHVIKNRSGEPVPLPVKLVNFYANVVEGKVKTNWQTINEYNTDRFIVEHSTDATTFSTIGSLPASNSLLGNNYSFIHINPLLGINYYRLKILDNDGKFSYSSVLKINLSRSLNFHIYPNIAHNFVIAEHPASDLANIQIMDMSGRIIQYIQTEKNKLQTRLSVNDLKGGTYLFVWTDGKETISKKVIVQ